MSSTKKWTPEQRTKFIATMKAKRKIRNGPKAITHTTHGHKPNGLKGTEQAQALRFLRQARVHVNKVMATKKIEQADTAHLLLLLALSSLEGNQPE